MDEIAGLLNIVQGVVFIEIRRHERPWLFSLDEYDENRFYRSVTTGLSGGAPSQNALQIL